MVLAAGREGAGATGALLPPRTAASGGSRPLPERGSQTLEFALALPLVTLLIVLVLHAGLLAVDLVAAQGLAREAARVAAVADDAATRRALAEAAGRRPVELTLVPVGPREPGTLVTAEVSLRSRAFQPFGPGIWLPARAVMRVEDR